MPQCTTLPIDHSEETIPPLDLDLETLNQRLETATPQEILRWAIATVPTGLVQTSTFSIPVTVHMLYVELAPTPSIPILFLDTLHHFPETLATVDLARSRYGLDLRVYRAQGVNSREEFAARYGEELWHRDVTQFHYLTKVEPLKRALQDIQVRAWITGRRRDQAPSRRQMPILEWDADHRLKVNPLANWSRKEVWNYAIKHNVIYNPLHDYGYTSIGDEPLTTPIRPGEDERAGRWRGSSKTECGIHL